MAWYKFIQWSKYIQVGLIVAMSAWLLYNIKRTAGTEGTLGKYKGFSWATCLLLLIGFCLSNVTLGKFRKSEGDDASEADDADSETEEEAPSEVLSVRLGGCIRKLAIYHNFIAFGYFHAAYSVIASLGAVLVFEAMLLSTVVLWQWHVGEYSSDLAHGALLLFVPGAFLVLAVVLIANVGGLYKVDEACLTYEPFDDTVSVPGAVFAGAFLKSFTEDPYKNTAKLFLGIFFMSFAPYAFMVFHQEHQGGGERSWKDVFKRHEVLYFLQLIWVLFGSWGFIFICLLFHRFYITAKLSLLDIMEQNWQQNLFACEQIVEQRAIPTLDILRSLLMTKKVLPSNTDVIKQAFHYVELPLWKAKPPFVPLQQQQQQQQE